ncbi:MAG TPA: lytic transglycosylase domain-containing protein [Nannocystaceae bacterium]|nr:lytic transglycosylase domain-containing protein [Nannocystaceae bacterium]
MSAQTSDRCVARAALVLVGILSAACGPMIHDAPRPPGAGQSTMSPVPIDHSPFSSEERARISAVDPWIAQAATKHRIDPDLLRGMVWVESRFDPRAQSPAGARGLMQLMPDTAKALARRIEGPRSDAYDPQFNVLAGTMYLSDMLARYRGDMVLALAAYNAGPGNVDRWLEEDGELPPRSREYAALVLAAKDRFETVWRVPAEHPGDTQLATHEPIPVRAPPPVVIPLPPGDDEADAPARDDLERVEPREPRRVVADEPERDVPVPSITSIDDEAAPAAAEPELGIGVLPSLAE